MVSHHTLQQRWHRLLYESSAWQHSQILTNIKLKIIQTFSSTVFLQHLDESPDWIAILSAVLLKLLTTLMSAPFSISSKTKLSGPANIEIWMYPLIKSSFQWRYPSKNSFSIADSHQILMQRSKPCYPSYLYYLQLLLFRWAFVQFSQILWKE